SLHVTLLLDIRGFTIGAYHTALLEQMLSALASIAVFLQSQGAPVALLANTNPPLIVPPGASVAHLQHVLEGLARLQPHAGPSLLPWALEDLPRGNSVVLATSELGGDVDHARGQLEASGFRVLMLVAAHGSSVSGRGPGALLITAECDLAARLEGRG